MCPSAIPKHSNFPYSHVTSHTRCTLLLCVVDGYVGCLHCVSICNTKSTVTFLTATLHSQTRCTLLLCVVDGYVGCLHCVSFCNTKSTVNFLTATLHSHTGCTLLLWVVDGYVKNFLFRNFTAWFKT